MAQEKIDIKIPGYKIERQLGRGGMASVYLAIQESMEREVALKIMLPALGATDPSFSERFVREAKIVAKLSHPHVNAVFDVGVAGQYHYFSMEYITGGDLKSRIRKGMTPKTVLTVVRQIASALAFAHSKGYVHRDVKPENVLFRENGTAVLTDFGIAKANDKAMSMTATGAVIGTPHYMSPEQAMGREIDRRSDIYSLGVMLYEMLVGKVPYTGDSAISIGIKHLKDPLPQLPPPLHVYQPLLDKFLAKDAAQRFQNGEEVIAAIDALGPGADTIATSATIVTGPAAGIERTVVFGPEGTTAPTQAINTGQRKRRRTLLIAAAVLVPLIAVAVFIKVRRPAQPPPIASAPAPAPVKPSAPVPDDAAVRAAEVAQVLKDADTAASAGQHFGSPDAAVPKYQRALELDPGNARAAQALNKIAGQVIAKAERAIEKNELDLAEALLKQAEEADATHPTLFSRRLALKELRQKQAAAAPRAERKAEAPKPAPVVPVKTAPAETPRQTVASIEEIRARERDQKLQGLLSRFQELVAPGALSATRAGMAQELVGEATRLAPEDGRVRALPSQLADAYLKLASTKAEEKDYKEADALIRRGLELSPSHKPLLALQQDITEKQKPKRQTFGSF